MASGGSDEKAYNMALGCHLVMVMHVLENKKYVGSGI